MMTNCISSDTNWLSQLTQVNNTNQATNTAGASSGNNIGAAQPAAPRGGDFLNAIAQALTQIGAGSNADNSTSTSSSSSSSQDPSQALLSFMHTLMQALHAQNGATATAHNGTDSDGDNDGSRASGVGGSGRHHHHLQANLQSLISELSSSSGGSSSSNSDTSDVSSSDSTISSLQQSYQNLLNALGDTGSTTTLGDFLQAFSNNLQDASTVGGLVKTQV